jgi:hypothetical protein
MSRIDFLDEQEEHFGHVPTGADPWVMAPRTRVLRQMGAENVRREYHPIVEEVAPDGKKLSQIIVVNGEGRPD